MSLSYEFVFENTFNILKNIIPEKKYKKLQKKAEKMNKRMKSYNMIVNENIIFSIMALYPLSKVGLKTKNSSGEISPPTTSSPIRRPSPASPSMSSPSACKPLSLK